MTSQSAWRASERFWRRSSTPTFARLYDAGVASDGRPYLALEYIEGEPLDRYCELHSLDLVARLGFVLQVARAVAYAHTRLIVHRDLKPSNIHVDSQGCVHLLDFGIAELLDPNVIEIRVTSSQAKHSPPQYPHPSKFAVSPWRLAWDVYSLGVVLYELLVGASPYERGENASVLGLARAVLTKDPVRPSEAATSPRTAQTARRPRHDRSESAEEGS